MNALKKRKEAKELFILLSSELDVSFLVFYLNFYNEYLFIYLFLCLCLALEMCDVWLFLDSYLQREYYANSLFNYFLLFTQKKVFRYLFFIAFLYFGANILFTILIPVFFHLNCIIYLFILVYLFLFISVWTLIYLQERNIKNWRIKMYSFIFFGCGTQRMYMLPDVGFQMFNLKIMTTIKLSETK